MGQKKFLPYAIILGAMAAWMLIAPHLFPAKTTVPEATTQSAGAARDAGAVMDRAATMKPGSEPAATGQAAATATAAAATMGTAATTPAAFAAPEEWTLGSVTGSDYYLHVVVSNIHAGMQIAEINPQRYSADLKGLHPEVLINAPETGYQSFTTTKITIDGDAYSLLAQPDGQPLTWTIDRAQSGADHVTFYLIFFDPQHPTKERLRLYKTFAIPTHGSYVVEVSHRVENRTAAPLHVTIDQIGPTSLYNHPPDDFRQDNRSYQAATFDKSKQYIEGAAQFALQASLAAGTNSVDMGSFANTGGDTRLVWVASNKRFFTVIVRPLGSDVGDLTALNKIVPLPNYIGDIAATPVVANKAHPELSLSALAMAGQTVSVPAGQSVQMPLELYMGPKDLHAFEGDIEAAPGSFAYTAALYKYDKLINFSRGGFCGWLTFAPVAKVILAALGVIHYVIPNYGVAIILLVIVIRLLLHPLTRRGQTSMARMQVKMAKAQPEIDRIKKKYAKDPAQLRTEQMRVFKEYDVNPAGQVAGCLPMLVQTPIWIALYAGLQVDIDLRHAMFIPGWITDLANPDMVWGSFEHPVFTLPILNMPIYGLNILPLLLGVVFFVNMKFQTKSAPKPADEQQAQMQKFSQYMILVIPLFLYNGSSGLNLYMFASTLGGIFDTWIVRKHLRREGLLPVKALAKA